MTDVDQISQREALDQFWQQVKDRTTVMLGLSAQNHAQPMTAFTEPDDGVIWFFTRDDTHLVSDLGAGAEGRLIFSSNDDLFADVTGALTPAHDRSRIDKYWNPVVAAWYPEGKDDSHLTLLRFEPQDGQIWVSKQGLLRFAFEITRANMTKTLPDLGGRADVSFPQN